MVEPVPITAKAVVSESVTSNPAITAKANNPLPATPPSQTELLQQREALYMDFQALSFALSHGQQPDTFKVGQMLNQQLQLVNAGVVPSEDALTYSRFLKKIMPQMNAELTQHIEKLEHVKHAS